MSGSTISNIFASLVGLAVVATLVGHKETAGIITATGKASADVFRAAMGR